MPLFTRPVLEINLSNIAANYNMLKKISGKSICAAVVKDDAYGLGAEVIAPFLYDEVGCRHFFVAHAREGQRIAASIPETEIFVLQGIGDDSLKIFQDCGNLIPVINCPEMLKFWNENKITGRKTAIHIETGLNRLGFRETEINAMSEEQRGEFSLVMSHLACGDEKDHFMNAYQLQNFQRLKQKYFSKTPASLSASDGIFLGTDFHQDMVRLGAAMYGINTAPYRENEMLNAVYLKAPVLQTEDLQHGQFVGYSATYRANTDRRIAIISVGYGDGIPRSLSNVGKVFFKDGQKLNECRMIGRISMDNIICDITNAPNVKVGDFAYLIDDFYTLDDIGRDAGTISYEILSRIGKGQRFDRRYRRTVK